MPENNGIEQDLLVKAQAAIELENSKDAEQEVKLDDMTITVRNSDVESSIPEGMGIDIDGITGFTPRTIPGSRNKVWHTRVPLVTGDYDPVTKTVTNIKHTGEICDFTVSQLTKSVTELVATEDGAYRAGARRKATGKPCDIMKQYKKVGEAFAKVKAEGHYIFLVKRFEFISRGFNGAEPGPNWVGEYVLA